MSLGREAPVVRRSTEATSSQLTALGAQRLPFLGHRSLSRRVCELSRLRVFEREQPIDFRPTKLAPVNERRGSLNEYSMRPPPLPVISSRNNRKRSLSARRPFSLSQRKLHSARVALLMHLNKCFLLEERLSRRRNNNSRESEERKKQKMERIDLNGSQQQQV